jgi:hypothetical protein
VNGIVSVLPQAFGYAWREGVVDDEANRGIVSGLSGCRGQREYTFSDGLGRESQSGSDVLSLEVGIGGENLLGSYAIRNHADHGRYGNPQTSDARHAAHLARIHGNAREVHGDGSSSANWDKQGTGRRGDWNRQPQ